jgi:superfamily II DNA/RNA helicase
MAARRPITPITSAPKPAGVRSPEPVSTRFSELGVPGKLVSALEAQGISEAFPIQAATLPDSLAGRDVLGRGRTGSGKTLAFVLPLLARLAKPASHGQPRALILAPTRELAAQITATIVPLAKTLSLRTVTIFGGVGARPQESALRAGVDILVACPGRLLDHLNTGVASLNKIEITVLDEADHMADLGFLPVVRRLLDLTPRGGQRMLFSATLDAGVNVLVSRYLTNPVTHSVDSAQSPVEAIDHHVLHVQAADRLPVLVDLTAAPGRTIVFTRTKHGAKKLTRQLVASGVPAVELHGNLSQGARSRSLAAFTDGSVKTLVATDIAARGIHVDDVKLVIHADPPIEHKAYLHRSGRTARAGAAGTVVTLMTSDQVRDVQDLTRKAGIRPTTTRLAQGHPLLDELAPGERVLVTAAPPAPAGRRGTRGAAQADDRDDERGNDRNGRRRASRARTGRSAQPATTASATRAAQPSRSAQPSRAAQPARAAEPSRSAQPSRSARISRAAEASSSTQPSRGTRSTRGSEPSGQQAQPVRTTQQSGRSAQPERAAQTTRSGQPSRAGQSSLTAQLSWASKPSRVSQPAATDSRSRRQRPRRPAAV